MLELFEQAKGEMSPREFWTRYHDAFPKPVPYKTVYRWLCESGVYVPRDKTSARAEPKSYGEWVEFEAVVYNGFDSEAILMFARDEATGRLLHIALNEASGTRIFLECFGAVLQKFGIPEGIRVRCRPLGCVNDRSRLNVRPERVRPSIAALGVDATFHQGPRKGGVLRSNRNRWLDVLRSRLRQEKLTVTDLEPRVLQWLDELNELIEAKAPPADVAFVSLHGHDVADLLWEETTCKVEIDHRVVSRLDGFQAKIESDEYRTSYARAQVTVIRTVGGETRIAYGQRALRFSIENPPNTTRSLR
ncbi:MAG: hypothetical protein AAF605_08710 [Myxococcota bacterium]